ncbi:MAG: endopeptidase La [Epsilonproteobacteria bacterium]|nr:endopeptidase La [Bacilli bacterium]NCA94732.1 endopeptidase La [Campylobacterota bacterium]HPK67161.1 endopeptidase La [Bacilli bacterium]HPY38561.1 endopeptidase La [Bacilli bacterium]
MDENLPLTLPLLVTRSLVVFPNTNQPIEAARPFSMKAIEESRDNASSLLFIVSQKDPNIDDPLPEDLYTVGTLCRIISFGDQKQFYRIRVTATKRVAIQSVRIEDNHYVADGVVLEDLPSDANETAVIVRNILEQIEQMPSLSRSFPRQVVSSLSKGLSPTELTDTLATYLNMPNEQKQALLEELDINKRLMLILDVINQAKAVIEIDKKIQNSIQKSTEKNQREYILREKMKAIKEELGEVTPGEDSEEDILKKLDANPFPEYVKTKVKAELKRYEMMPQASLEASLIKSYIDLIMNLPWYQKTEDNDVLEDAERILNEDHYGLDKVKKRIIEYLAVKKMTGNLKAPILCFYGPPGVGKTSLGKSIARALGRKFFKASLGGISDEAEIRGHRRTYVGSMPGRIISGMRKTGVINPVFLLDEVDKLSTSYKGDPASALLEVLDPEQNFAFNDNYVEEPYDLSNVLFIATANYLENIPAPLRDRLELIEVNSYTELEKIQIAKHFLLKKQMKANGIENKNIKFSDEAFQYIIQYYTREAGVRELERKIAAVIRKIVVEIVKNPNLKVLEVTPADVRKHLGVEIFENTKKEKENQIGVVTGLAYTEYGGDILPIEVNYFPGKGNLVLTGKLGDVMKESASIALDYVRSNAIKYGIDSDIFAKNDIHVHVPEGAVPKDGPSAGIAITTAIVSCLTRQPVDANVAMTGEVTLRGYALPIGGLREKSLAALRSGIKTIIVPKENQKAVDELPKEVKEALNIVYMKTVDDALDVACVK